MKLKKIAFFAVIFISAIIINNLVHSIYTLWQKKAVISQAQQELGKVQKRNQDLKSKLSLVNKPQFVEEQARNKLFLVKPGEGIIVIPSQYLQASSSATPAPPDIRPNWKKWWDVFF